MADQRWERLFEDLEAQLAAQDRLDTEAEIADRTRRERALISWVDRLSACLTRTGDASTPVSVSLASGVRLTGRVSDLGQDWVLLDTPSAETLVPLAAVMSVHGLGTRAAQGGTARRFGVGSALRTLARDRATVEVVDLTGQVTTGTIDVVLADAIEVAEHPLGEARRAENVRDRVLLPVSAISLVRRRA